PAPEAAHGTRDAARDEWALRSEGAVTRHLEQVRDAVFALAKVERQHLVLDAHAAGGLLTWEALRRAPQGGVWARTDTEAEARTLEQEAKRRAVPSELVAFAGAAEHLARRIAETDALLSSRDGIAPGHGLASGADRVRFDRVLARGLLA